MSITIDNLAEFNTALKTIVKDNERRGAGIVGKVSFDAFGNLQRKTPRKTGRARAGWHNTVDRPVSEWKPPRGRDHYAGEQFKGGQAIKFNSTVNLTNNVEYIIPLDKGTSKQAANGIVQPVFARLAAHLNKLINVENRRRVK